MLRHSTFKQVILREVLYKSYVDAAITGDGVPNGILTVED